MVQLIADDLGATQTYARREMRAIVGGTWEDGRAATVWLDMQTAQTRYRAGKHCKSVLSRYGVAEVEEVGFQGRSFIWDKEFPDNEHEQREDLPKPPYTVRLDCHGEIWCTCMGDKGNHRSTCRHCDATLYLLDAGAFGEEEPPPF